jgi:hypothetical protein
MGKKKHVAWDFYKDYHQGDSPGCIWRHASGWGNSPCHYAMNGFAASASRTDMYNKDHRSVARELGYVLDAEPGKGKNRGDLKLGERIRREVAAKARSQGKGLDFRQRFERRFGSSIKWLSLHPEGWHYGHGLEPRHIPKRYGGRVQPTFKVKKKEEQGYGAWYPYHHNYHHLIPQGALHEYVIGNDALSGRRVEIICASKWNINARRNIVLLPQENSVSRIVGLPAHCPWGLKHHPAYSSSMKDKLKNARKRLDKAMDTGACEDNRQVAFSLDKASDSILKQIKTMRPGRQLGRVK